MEIEFSGQPDKETYFKAIRWIFKPSKKSTLIRVAVFVSFTALYLVVVFGAVQEGDTSAYEISRLIRHLFTVLLLGYILVQPAINSYRKANSLWNDPSSRRHRTGRVSPLGVLIDPMTDWMRWETFIRVDSRPDYIVLLTASRMFILLQRSFFRDEQEWKLVQNMVAQKVQEVSEQ